MSELAGRTIVVAVGGGIAAYKVADLVSKLAQEGALPRVIMTAHATEFVGPATFQALSGQPVHTATFAAPETYGMGHLSLQATADALLVAPATANLLAKAAAGICDDLVSTTIASLTCPILFAPAMNSVMWHQPANQRNLATLRADGRTIVGPGSGWLACREVGEGRLAEVPALLDALRVAVWPEKDLAGRRVLITAGPTREPLDAVRFVSNPSTGKQGYAMAAAARIRGAEVTLVSGPVSLPAPDGVELVQIASAAEMAAAVWSRCEAADVVIGGAAVGDYAPVAPALDKPAKSPDGLTLRLEPTADIIAEVGRRRRPGQVLVGFAAETHDLADHALEKLRRKGLDFIVANDVSAPDAGFGTDLNRVRIFGADGSDEALEPMSKRAVAHAVLRRAAARFREIGDSHE